MPSSFADIALIIIASAVFGVIARLLRQPTIVAYLITGITLGALGILRSETKDMLHVMATFGITLLLFLVGLQMRFDTIKTVGKVALFTGLGQIVFTSMMGFGIVKLMGMATLPALYIAIALTFSSTIVVVKLLSQKRDLQSMYGRIVVGFLIIQDIVAILMLIILAGFRQGGESISALNFLLTIGKSVILFSLIIWLSQKVFPWFFEKLARVPELLFVASIAWAFGISWFVSSDLIGLSIEIGGFLAGLALAKSLEQFQIEAQLRPLRDFFIVIFFVVLGSSLVVNDFGSIIVPGILLSLFVLIANPLIMLIIMGSLGFKKKTSFYSSMTVAQISEFSLIVMAMGLSLNHVSTREVSIVTFVGITTFLISTYLILYNHQLYEKFSKYLHIFERKNSREEIPLPQVDKGPIILAGANRLGSHLLHAIDKQKLVVVDFDPVVVKHLHAEGYKVVFGDVTDTDIQEHIHMETAHVFISTIPDLEDNLLILKRIQEMRVSTNRAPKVVVTAYTAWEAKKLYESGADYVVLPHFVGGKHLATLMKGGRLDETTMVNWRHHDEKVLAAT